VQTLAFIAARYGEREAQYGECPLVDDRGTQRNALKQGSSFAFYDASSMPTPRAMCRTLGFAALKSAGAVPVLLAPMAAGLTGAATRLVQLADLAATLHAQLGAHSLAAVPVCDEMNVGVATQQLLANVWMYHKAS